MSRLWVWAKSLQSTTPCDPMDCSPPDSSVHGILQAKILKWAATPSSRDLPKPGIEPTSSVSPALQGRFFTIEPRGEAPELMRVN